jgi:hypothetical protein
VIRRQFITLLGRHGRSRLGRSSRKSCSCLRLSHRQAMITSGISKTLGLEVPPTLLARADEVIE